MVSLMLMMGITLVAAESPIKSDEVVVFFPTYGQRDGDDWVLNIHGWIYEPEKDSPVRRETIENIRRALDVKEDSKEAAILRERVALFLVDNERSKRISIRVGTKVHEMEESAANGQFHGKLRLSSKEAETLLQEQQSTDGWLTYHAVTPRKDNRTFAGRVQVLEPTGISVISDIDDTIKVTEVTDLRALLANTFLREFRAVPGMSELYRGWARRGAAFHYVSSSPWQLYPPLAYLFEREQFPAGAFHLKLFRAKDSSLFSLFASPEKAKTEAIGPILAAFPRRKFVLVGDSSEKDPEIYGALARKHAAQIAGILIRNTTAESPDSPRLKTAFEGVPADRWRLFREPKEIEATAAKWFE